MTHRFSIVHRKPRTWRERTLARFHRLRADAHRRWRRLRHRFEHRADHARVQKLFLQLSDTARSPDDLRAGTSAHKHLHLRHPKR